MASVAWAMGFLNSPRNNLFTLKLHFCESTIISHFCCEQPWLFPLILPLCPTSKEFLFSGSSAFLRLLTLPLILFSYSRIMSAMLSICSSEGQDKAFPHLTVVHLFYRIALLRDISPRLSVGVSGLHSVQCDHVLAELSHLHPHEPGGGAALQRELRPQKLPKA